jgi:acetyl esterase/lipase
VILYIHGGGFVLGRPEMADNYLAALAEELKTLIVAVDYRLAPEHPFPLPLEDCYTALGWLFGDDHELGIDTRKVVIMRHSASGGLTRTKAPVLSAVPAPNRFCWDCLRGVTTLTMIVSAFFHRPCSETFKAPPSFISVGSLYLFLEEDLEFALRLSRAGGAAELHVDPGAPHMFDKNPGRITTQSNLDIVRALKAFLKER